MKKRILGILVILTLCLCLLPMTAGAAEQTVDITNDADALTTALTSAQSSDTVTVTGTLNTGDTGITLTIPEGVTVDWQAALTGGTSSNSIDVLTVKGSGTFTMGSGSITNTYGNSGSGSALKVEGSVSATISGSAAISAPGQICIYHNSSAAMTVSGGTVSECSSAIVCGSSGGGGALNVSGGEVSGENGIVIYGGSQVAVSNGTVSGISAGIMFQSSTIGSETTPNIVVSGGTVKGIGLPNDASSYGHGILCNYPAYIFVTGGTVTSEDGTGIVDSLYAYNGSGSTTISISGGTVSSTSTVSDTAYSAIQGYSSNSNPTKVVLSGTANISAAGGWGIYYANTVEIASGTPTVSGAAGGILPFSPQSPAGTITIAAGATLTVNGTGTGTAESSPGIRLPARATLVVDGELAVSGTTGVFSMNWPVSVTVNSGGLLDAKGTAGSGVGIYQNASGTATVTVAGTLKATGAGYGVSANTVTVSEGGVLDASSTGGNALFCAAALNVDSGVLRAVSSSTYAYSGYPSTITISGNSHIVFSGTSTPNYGNATTPLVITSLTNYYWYTGEAKSDEFNEVTSSSGTALTVNDIKSSKYFEIVSGTHKLEYIDNNDGTHTLGCTGTDCINSCDIIENHTMNSANGNCTGCGLFVAAAQVESTYYTDLATAAAAFNTADNQTLTLHKDVTGNISATVSGTLTLNAKTLTGDVGIQTGKTLTINDGGEITGGIANSGTLVVSGTTAPTLGTITLSGGTIQVGVALSEGQYTVSAGAGQFATAINSVALEAGWFTSANSDLAVAKETDGSLWLKKSIASATVTVNGSYTYTGTAQTPTDSNIVVKVGDDTLVKDTDYTVAVTNNTNAGTNTAVVTITGINNYTGTATGNFTIAPASINSATVTIGGTYTYNGTAQTPQASNVTVKLMLNGTEKTLEYGADKDYTYAATNNKNAGTDTAVVTVTGTGNYIGTATGNFSIGKFAATVTPASGQSKTYGAVDPDFTYTDNLFDGDSLTGALSRAEGETLGEYAFSLGTLANDNYTLALAADAPKFAIEKANVTLSVELSPSSQKVNKDVTVTVTAKNAGTSLLTTGWTQPTGVTVTVGGTNVTMTQTDAANGKWAGTYHIAADAALGDITVTASVSDQTGNYTNPVDQTTTLTVTDKGPVTVAVTASKTTGVTYGDSVTYTATIAKYDSTDTDTLDGTVAFYLNPTDTSTLAQIAATGEKIGESTNMTGATVTLDKSKLTAGNHTVYAVYGGNAYFATGSGNAATTVGKATLSWDVSGLTASKKAGSSAEATVYGTLALSGVLTGDTVTVAPNTGLKTSGFTATTAGDHTVSVVPENGSYSFSGDNGNYDLPSGNPQITATVNAVQDVVLEQKDNNGNALKVEVETGLSAMPSSDVTTYLASLNPTVAISSPEDLEVYLKTVVTEKNTSVPASNTAVYDVALMVSTDGGNTWQLATAANFPADGLNVLLPYPAGTTSSYKFTVVHMFTTNDFGKQPGATETPAVTNTANGIQFKVTGLSPISLGWTAPQQQSSGGGGVSTYAVTVEDSENGSVKSDRSYASGGSTVTLTVTPEDGYALNTLTVADERGNSVEITDNGDGTYSFKMPYRKVSVTASFVSIARTFTDIKESDYFYTAVLWAVDEGITVGTSATTFSPDASCTRAQMATFLWRAAGSPDPVGSVSPFTDIPADAYYATAVQWAVEQGITVGTSTTTFSPDADCTRAQMATFLWRAAGSPDPVGSVSPFTDILADAYYAKAVQWAYEQGITAGTSATTFSPDSDCTRAQIVTFLYRHFGK